MQREGDNLVWSANLREQKINLVFVKLLKILFLFFWFNGSFYIRNERFRRIVKCSG